MPIKLRVGILGATVGQRFIEMLERHPQFDVTAVAASERFENKPDGEACSWRPPGEMPDLVWCGVK
jgi:aspartate-semialdehyde dehydrogenase